MFNNAFIGDAAGSLKRPLKGLSCLLGNWHGQFLEGWGLVTAPGYSAIRDYPPETDVLAAQTKACTTVLADRQPSSSILSP